RDPHEAQVHVECSPIWARRRPVNHPVSHYRRGGRVWARRANRSQPSEGKTSRQGLARRHAGTVRPGQWSAYVRYPGIQKVWVDWCARRNGGIVFVGIDVACAVIAADIARIERWPPAWSVELTRV